MNGEEHDPIPREGQRIEDLKQNRDHYYAEHIRALFFTGAIIMLLTFPLFSQAVNASGIFVIFGIVVIILAGLTNRGLKTLFLINAMVSLLLVIVLEFLAQNLTFNDHPFLVILNQFLALIFVVALYYSLRTIRGFLFK